MIASEAVNFTMHLRCPHCEQTIAVETPAAATWGRVSPTDLGIAEVTILDSGGVLGRHMNEHREQDPQAWMRSFAKEVGYQKRRAENFFAEYGPEGEQL